MKRIAHLILAAGVFLSACGSIQELTPLPATQTSAPATAPAQSTEAAEPSITPAPMEPTSVPVQTNGAVKVSEAALIIDSQSLTKFDSLSDEEIASAAALRLMYRHASVGENISLGLDCLWGNYPGRRPNSCSDVYDPRLDRSQWDFQFRGNPSWIEKVDDFVQQTETQIDQYEVFMFSEDYVDGIDNPNFPAISDAENFQKQFVEPLEKLEAAHPDKIFVLWSMSLARLGYANTTRFNEMIRAYAQENGKILFDIAGIEAHDPQGNLITDESGNPIIYQGYTNEAKAGHLNEAGRERLARAFWVLMSTVAAERVP
jgi:hypothetical protein